MRTPAVAIVGSVVYALNSSPKTRLNLLVGAGPLTGAELRASLMRNGSDLVELSDTRTGMYVHGGLEGEYLFHRRFALDVLADYRKANSGKLNFGLFGGPGLFDLNGRAVDFSGWSVQVGLRAFVGY